eukprot:1237854-Rhodomonas_salina.4
MEVETCVTLPLTAFHVVRVCRDLSRQVVTCYASGKLVAFSRAGAHAAWALTDDSITEGATFNALLRDRMQCVPGLTLRPAIRICPRWDIELCVHATDVRSVCAGQAL